MGGLGAVGSCRAADDSRLRDVNHLTDAWRATIISRTAMPSWRGLVSRDIWNDAPAVVLVDKSGRRNTYEVYVQGKQVSREWLLADAKERAERDLGSLRWSRANTAQIRALHYWFGWTTEFTDPTIFYVGVPSDR